MKVVEMTLSEDPAGSVDGKRSPFKRKRVLWIVVSVVVAIASFIAWNTWDKSQQVKLHRDEALNHAISTVYWGGDPILIRDVVSFEWDEVALFHEATSIDEINAVVGDVRLRSSYYWNSYELLVFRNKGKVTRLVTLNADVGLSGEFGRLLGRDAMVMWIPSTDTTGHAVLTE